jgi:hypothetical protein
MYEMVFKNNPGRLVKEVGPISLVGLELCATSSPRVILSVTMFYFGHNEYMPEF